MALNKEELRLLYKQVRLRMSSAEVRTKSRIICRKALERTDWQKYKSVCVYKPIKKLNEVDIGQLNLILRKHDLAVHELGQSASQSLPSQKFDLIIVPVLAFDKENYRLGWGGGFYDRFLATQPKALKIGVCFQNGQVEEGLPREPHDIQLDKIITEV